MLFLRLSMLRSLCDEVQALREDVRTLREEVRELRKGQHVLVGEQKFEPVGFGIADVSHYEPAGPVLERLLAHLGLELKIEPAHRARIAFRPTRVEPGLGDDHAV